MIRLIKFELFKLIKEPFLWGTVVIVMIVNCVMTAGMKTTLDGLLQKSFITAIISSLFVAFNVGNDFENGRILYTVLSGNSRLKTIISKMVVAILAAEILTLLFPCIEILKHQDWDFNLKSAIIINYTLLGIFLGVLGMSMAWLFKNAGIAIIGLIVYHLCTLFLMNSNRLGNLAMSILPIGIVKLQIVETAQFYSRIIFGGWILLLVSGVIVVSKYSDL